MPKAKMFHSKEVLDLLNQKPHSEWCFTINNYTNDDIHALFALPIGWKFVVGKEVAPTTGTKHLQGIVWNENNTKVDRKVIESMIGGRAHLEYPIQFENALGYCLKDGNVLTNTVYDLTHFLSMLRIFISFSKCSTWLFEMWRHYVGQDSADKHYSESRSAIANYWDCHAFNHSHPPYDGPEWK